MAANAKGKRNKVKGKTVDLNTFLGEDHEAAPGFAVVQTRKLDWGAAMENEDLDDRYTLDYKKEEKVVLPTAPKAARGPDVDLNRVPTSPPYTAFLGNLPYDVSEEDITAFFRQLQVKNVRLPRDNGDRGRIRGFGYAEFNDRQDLIQALALNNESLKNRAIKVSLAGEHDGDNRGDRGGRDSGPDRTLGDWRSARSDPFPSNEPNRNDSYGSRGGFPDRDSYRGRSGYDSGRFERNDDRNDSFSRNNRDFGNRDDDRFERRNDRGYGFSSDRDMNRGGRRDFGSRDNFPRRDEPSRESRFRDSDRDYPPRDNYERKSQDRPSYESSAGQRERPKLQLAPRTKPIEPVPPPAEAVTSSSIFGGAKPVDTAAREREIEERLAREKDVTKDPKERVEERVRKFSSGSGISNRSRQSSDSGPPGTFEDDQIPPYKPPLPKQADREPPQQFNTLPSTRQRNSSNSSGGSDKDAHLNSKANHPPPNRKDNQGSDSYSRCEQSILEPPRQDSEFRSSSENHSPQSSSRDNDPDSAVYEEPKPPVYTSANKFSQLMNDAEDLDKGSNSE